MYPTRLYLFWNTIPSLKIPSNCGCNITEYNSYNWTRQNWLNANLTFKNLQNTQNVQNTFSTFCWCTYRILTMPVWTPLHDWIWDAEWGFHLIVTALQLQVGTGSFSSSPSHSIEKRLHMTYFLVWGHSKQVQITRSHCTCWAVRAASWSGKSTSGGGQACGSALYEGGRA